ncbi:hypothetical protein MHYP_G00235650 [Metynnis hypsauchen]
MLKPKKRCCLSHCAWPGEASAGLCDSTIQGESGDIKLVIRRCGCAPLLYPQPKGQLNQPVSPSPLSSKEWWGVGSCLSTSFTYCLEFSDGAGSTGVLR